MSKIGKKPIPIPDGASVQVQGSTVSVTGPRGTLSRNFPADFNFVVEDKIIRVVPPQKSKKNTMALWGSARANLANIVKGVTSGFKKILEFEGIGWRAEASAKELTLNVGFSHPVRLSIPEGTSVQIAKNTIEISGNDKEAVGKFAALLRLVRLPEPYKGTGIRYRGEVIRRKAGKKLAGAAGAGVENPKL